MEFVTQNCPGRLLVFLVILATWTVTVQGNNPPRLSNFDGFTQALEREKKGTVIKTLTATDQDGPNEISFRINPNSVETQNLVTLSAPRGTSTTGRSVDVILNVDDLDSDYNADERTLRFQILDGLNSPVDATLTLFIRDINDVAPQFMGTPYRVSIKEDAPVGTQVFNGTSTADPDSGLGGSVTYSLETNDAEYKSTFNVTAFEGYIYLIKPLDYETHNFYQLRLTARDGQGLNSTTDVLVTVEDVQDTPPRFVNTPYVRTILENATVGSSVIAISAQDGDRGNSNPITYKFIGNTHGDSFTINETTGVISVARALDSGTADVREQGSVFDFTVQGRERIVFKYLSPLKFEGKEITSIIYISANETQQFFPQKGNTAATMLVTITVEDINNNSPEFDQSSYTAELSENAQRGIPITLKGAESIFVQDKDQNTNSKFRVTVEGNGQTHDAFSVSPSLVFSSANLTVLVKNSQLLDYESLTESGSNVLTFELVAKETDTAERRSGTATVTVTVMDENDNFPQFTNATYEASVREDAGGGAIVTQISATDLDSGDFGNVTYSLRQGGDGKFIIDKYNGYILVESGAELDRETRPLYYLTVEATDGGGNRNTTLLVITVLDANDNNPKFLRTQYSGFLQENQAFQPLLLSASDADEMGTPNSEVTYNLSYVPTELTGNFSIVTENGEGKISVTPNLDFERLPSHLMEQIVLQVTAYDHGDPQLNSTVNVTIQVEDKNDNPPEFNSTLYSGDMLENATGGHLVATVAATDQDGKSPNNEIQYSIQSGGLDKFFMEPTSGQLTVAQGAKFDRDAQDSYILIVVARDKGSPQLSGSSTVNVTIKDINNKAPEFKPPVFSFQIKENSSLLSPVGKVSATDLDEDAQLEYELLSNQTTGIDENGRDVTDIEIRDYFEVNAATGDVTVKSDLDRETAEMVTLKVLVTDRNAVVHPQTATGTVSITLLDFNDHPPQFSEPQGYNESVSERENKGYEVMTLSATDADKGQTVTFTIQDPDDNFEIIQKDKIVLKEKLDRESSSSHSFTVTATDNGNPPLSSNTTVTVTVLDENDNNPVFVTTDVKESIPENSTKDTLVTTLLAVDSDAGAYGTVQYFINRGDDKLFRINRTTGQLFVNGVLDRETTEKFELRIEARDNNEDPDPSNRRSNFTQVTITLTDINDNPPSFNGSVFTVTEDIMEDSRIGTLVYTLTATDRDTGNNARITYHLGKDTNATNSASEDLFQVDPRLGQIRVMNSLVDYVGWHYLTIVAADDGSPKKSATATVLVDVKDVNIYAPVFENITVPIYVDEAHYDRAGVSVYNFTATDRDKGVNGKVKYELTAGSGIAEVNPTFSLDNTTGELTTKTKLDYETTKSYTLYVKATDFGTQPSAKSSRIEVVIQVVDADDNPPQFNGPRDKPTVFSINEESTGIVGTVKAFDLDSSNSSRICYCFIGDHTDFILDQSSGNISLIRKVDRERNPEPRDLVIKALQFCNNCDSVSRKKRAVDPPPLYNASDPTQLWIRVVIADVNDNKPMFTTSEVSVGITRETQYGDDILSLSEYVRDLDAGNNTKHEYSLIGDIQSEVDNLNGDPNNMFNLLSNGVVRTNTYFQADWFGFFTFSVRVKDSAGNSTTSVKIYLINQDQQVKIVILNSVEAVNKTKELLVERLENITGGGYDIIVDKVKTHEKEDGKPDPTKVDLFIHGVEKKTQKVISGSELLKLIDSKLHLLIDTYKQYAVVEVQPAVVKAIPDSEEKVLKMALILVAILLGMVVIVLAFVFYICRKKYKRKLRAATAMAFGAKESEMSKMDMPGTNLHAFEGSNPIWNEKYENIGLDDNDSQNSLDANEIDISPQNQFDEQEVSMDLYNDDYENFNKIPPSKLGPSDLHLNAAIREHEESKNKRNKDIVNNNEEKYGVNGSVKYTNGSVESLSTFNTKNVNGLQTTEI